MNLYGGASIGGTYLNVKAEGRFGDLSDSETGHDFVFTYGFGGGLLISILDPLHIDLNYRYLIFDDASFDLGGTVGNIDYNLPDTHRVSIGVMLKF